MSRVNNVNKIKQNSQHFSSIFTIGFIRLGLVIILLLLVRSRLLLPAMLVFFLLFMVESARFWSRYALKRLNPSITLFPQRLFAGEEMKLKLSWHNNKLLPAMIDWKQPLPPSLTPLSNEPDDKQLSSSFLIKWFETFEETFHLRAIHRGVYILPPLEINSRDGLNLFSSQVHWTHGELILVYPKLISLPEFHLNPADFIGSKPDRRPVLPDPIRISGLREYTADMPSRLIHWKASAQKGQLFAKILEPSADLQLCIAVDVTCFYPEHLEEFENALSVVSTLVSWSEEQRIPLGLTINAERQGIDGPTIVPVSWGSTQATLILESLARLNSIPYGKLDTLLFSEENRLPFGTTLLVLGDGTEISKPPGVRHVNSFSMINH